jgi:hypothetical protein
MSDITETLLDHARAHYNTIKKWQFVDGLMNWIREQLPADDDAIEIHWRDGREEGGSEWDRLQIEGFLRWLLRDIPDDTHMIDPAPYDKKTGDYFDCRFKPKAGECSSCPEIERCPWERNGSRRA